MVVRKGLLTLVSPFSSPYHTREHDKLCTNSQLKAIEELKDKAKSGAKLETTQHKKIETEGEIRRELAAAITAAGGEA
jgi:uncharacterized protein with WD repeat